MHLIYIWAQVLCSLSTGCLLVFWRLAGNQLNSPHTFECNKWHNLSGIIKLYNCVSNRQCFKVTKLNMIKSVYWDVWCVLPLHSVKCDSPLKKSNSQVLILAYAAIKCLENIIKYSNFLQKKGEMVKPTSAFSVTCTFRMQMCIVFNICFINCI